MKVPLLGSDDVAPDEGRKKSLSRALWLILVLLTISVIGFAFKDSLSSWVLVGETSDPKDVIFGNNAANVVESERGAVAADDARCSEIGASMLRQGGHAVDAAVATALCGGVVNSLSSGIGGGAFMIVRSASTSKTQAFDSRETAPAAASEDMYADNIKNKYVGAMSMGVPGEIAGFHRMWSEHGRLPWKTLFEPAIKLAREGYAVGRYLGLALATHSSVILSDSGLKKVFAPNGSVLKAGEKCYNRELAQSLEAVAEHGPEVYYNGPLGKKVVEDVREAGGILTMDDLRNYEVDVIDALSVDVMGGYTIHGMPPPSSGTAGFLMVLKILDSYSSFYAAKGRNLGLHRVIEAMKHMFAARMDLGDPHFVNITDVMNKMLSPSFAKEIRQEIFDNTTFPSEYYTHKWSQLRDHGTSHICVVDSDRNTVSMTTTVNYFFGAGVISPSTGILLNNEMGDFSIPTEISSDSLPPAPANFIKPGKRPLSSMTPLIITKDDRLVGAIGGSGGIFIIPAVIQVFLDHFILGMKPLAAVESPRLYHRLIPNKVQYENWTVVNGDHYEVADETKLYLKERHHELEALPGGAIVQLIVQDFKEETINMGRKSGKDSTKGKHGKLTAVSDPRKDGKPAAV